MSLAPELVKKELNVQLYKAVSSANIPEIKALLEKGAPVDITVLGAMKPANYVGTSQVDQIKVFLALHEAFLGRPRTAAASAFNISPERLLRILPLPRATEQAEPRKARTWTDKLWKKTRDCLTPSVVRQTVRDAAEEWINASLRRAAANPMQAMLLGLTEPERPVAPIMPPRSESSADTDITTDERIIFLAAKIPAFAEAVAVVRRFQEKLLTIDYDEEALSLGCPFITYDLLELIMIKQLEDPEYFSDEKLIDKFLSFCIKLDSTHKTTLAFFPATRATEAAAAAGAGKG